MNDLNFWNLLLQREAPEEIPHFSIGVDDIGRRAEEAFHHFLLVSSQETMKKNPQKVQGIVAALHRTMNYILNPANRAEVVQYVSTYHRIDLPLAEKAFTAQMLGYSKDGTKPSAAVEKEIEIYRETLKVAKAFTPDDLEDMSWLRLVKGR